MTQIFVNPGDPLQEAANGLTAGDELVFRPGVHYGRITVLVDDVVLRGEDGAIVEGTDAFGNWQEATDGDDYCNLSGSGTWRAPVSYQAWNLVDQAGNGLHLIHPDYVNVKEPNNYYKTAFEAMCVPNGATTPADYGANWWDGIEAYWTYNPQNGHIYVRYRDGRKPTGMRSCPDGSVIELWKRRNISIENLTIRGGVYGIAAWDSSNVLVNKCRLTGSHLQVYINGTCDQVRIAHNYFNLSILGTIASQPVSKLGSDGNPKRHITFHQYASYKFFRDKSASTGGCGVAVWNGWNESAQQVKWPTRIEIDHNHCENSTYHVDLSGGDGIDIHHNYTNNMMDMPFQRSSNNGRNVQIHDNESHEAGYCLLRWHHPEQEAGDNYLYNNRCSDVEGVSDFFAFTGYDQNNPPANLRMWIYQNSFNGGNMTAVHGGVSSMDYVHWINNILPYGPQVPHGKNEGNFQGSHVWPVNQIERDFIVPVGHAALSCAVDLSAVYPFLPDADLFTSGQAGWISRGDEPPNGGETVATFLVEPNAVAPGADVEVSWTGGISDRDWYALYAVPEGNKWDEYGWAYTSSCGEEVGPMKASGTCIFTMPEEPGVYQFQFYADDGDELLASSNQVTVSENNPEPEPDMVEVLIRAWVKREDVSLVPQKKKAKK